MSERDDDARQGGKRAGDQERGAGSRRAGGRRGEQARSERQPRTRERQVQAGRSDVYDEPPLEPRPKRTTDPSPAPGRGPERSGHTLQDDEVPDVRFAGSEASEGNLSDFTDETSAGHHAGYGDYGQQDYGPHGEKVPGGENPSRPHQRKPDKRAVPAESGSAEGESAEGESAEREKADPDTQGAVGRATPKTG